jgi:subtilase family serine protease
LTSAFTPAAIRKAYGIDQITVGGVLQDGTGMTIAIVDAYDDPALVSRSSTLPLSQDTAFLTSDLHQFDVQYGLPEPAGFFTKVDENGGSTYPATDPAGPGHNNWEAEEALDVEWAHAIAPGANIILIEANSSSGNDLFVNGTTGGTYYAGHGSGAQVVSMSFGGNEFSGEDQYNSSLFSGTGITFLEATGDNGSTGLGTGAGGFASYLSNVVAVGGTSLTVSSGGAYSSESGWSGSGGGLSRDEAQPAYQAGVTIHSGSSVVNSQGKRANPDVSFDANPSTGISVYDSYNGNSTGGPWYQFGGTSVATPCWAGLIAIADQIRAGHGLTSLTGSSQTLPTLYKLLGNSSAYAADFHDITSGSNGHYKAATGYDLVTGIGSPVASQLIPDLAGVAVTNVTSTTANGTYGIGATVTIDVTFSGTATVTGTPQLALNSGGTAAYTGGSGSNTLAFTYVVAAGDQSAHLDYSSATALSASGGTIVDNASNPAVLTLPAPGAAGSLGANTALAIVTLPVVTSVAPATGPTAGGTTVTIAGLNFTAASTVAFGGTAAASFTVDSGTSITAVAPAGTDGTVDITVTTPVGTSATSSADQYTYLPPIAVSSVVINADNPALSGPQRSMVDSIVFTFNHAVTLGSGAFTIALHAGVTVNGAAGQTVGTVPTLTWASPDGGVTWVVTFSGAGVSGGSIADGVYDITLNASAVTDAANQMLSGDRVDTFYRLFGDVDGNGRVNATDYSAFVGTFGLRSGQTGFLAAFDVDADGRVNSTDYNAFVDNFGDRFSGFTPTI